MKIKKMRFSNNGGDNYVVSDDDDKIIRLIGIEEVIKYKIKSSDDVKKYIERKRR